MTERLSPFQMGTSHTHRSPMKYQVYWIVGLFIAASCILMGMGYMQSETLNSVRAFVRGEGLWGKAQKNAVFYLERYAVSQDETDYLQFKRSLQTNLGDKQARLALIQEPPDIELAQQGFLAGGNHPDDVPNMISFFLRFQNFYYLRKAINIWEVGDVEIAKLIKHSHKIHLCVQSQNPQCLTPLLADLEVLNSKLDKIATDFSSILSEGARWIKSTLLTASIILICFLSLGIYFITRRIIFVLTRTERELIISEDRFLSLYDANVIGMMDWHVNGEILSANDAYLKIIGYTRDELDAGKINWKKITPDDYKDADKKAAKELGQYGACIPYEKEFIHKQGHRVSVYLGAALLNGDKKKGICFVVDQSTQKLNETQLKLSATVFDASSDGIIITDQYKHIVAVNKAYLKKTGLSKEQLVGITPPIFVSKHMPDNFFLEVSEQLAIDDHWQGDVIDCNISGETIPVSMSINTVRDTAYKISHYVINITDISDRKAIEMQLTQLAHYDYLTGLANRSLYQDRLNQALIRAKRHKAQCALLFFDLDKFKPINDEFGHEIGDLLLQTVATRMKSQVRDNDTVARLGGDEFVIIMEDLHQATHAADLANKIINAVSQPCHIDDKVLNVGCSVGISIYPHDGKDAISLTRNADIAMYAAKGSGQNRYYFFNPANQ